MLTGKTLRMIRQARGIKQETIAKKLCISQPAYCKIEKHDCINENRIHQIAAAIGISKEELERAGRILSELDNI